MGGVGDGAAEEDGSWDLNPGAAAKERERERTMRFWERRERIMQLWWSREREPHCFGRVGTPWRQYS